MCPQGTVVEVAGADGIDLNLPCYQLQCKALGKTDSAELAARIGAVVLGTLQTGFGVNLKDQLFCGWKFISLKGYGCQDAELEWRHSLMDMAI